MRKKYMAIQCDVLNFDVKKKTCNEILPVSTEKGENSLTIRPRLHSNYIIPVVEFRVIFQTSCFTQCSGM